MPEIRDYSPLAAQNTATPPGGWAEGTLARLYGSIVRELMARARRWWSDTSGVAISTGSGGAYAVATAQAAVAQPGMRVCFFANHQNPNAAPTANIGGTGDREMIFANGSTIPALFINAGQLVEVVWDNARSKWATFIVPSSQFAGTVTGSQISLEGQAQGSVAIRSESGWRASSPGTTSQFFRGGPNPGFATVTGAPGMALLACSVQNNSGSYVAANRTGMPYTATVSRQSAGVYRLLISPSNLPTGYIVHVSYYGGSSRLVAAQNKQLSFFEVHLNIISSGADTDIPENNSIEVVVF